MEKKGKTHQKARKIAKRKKPKKKKKEIKKKRIGRSGKDLQGTFPKAGRQGGSRFGLIHPDLSFLSFLSRSPPVWGHQKAVTPVCSDLFRFPRFLPICSDLHSLFSGIPRFVPICSDLIRFLTICFQNKSEQIRESPFCRPILQFPDLRLSPIFWVCPIFGGIFPICPSQTLFKGYLFLGVGHAIACGHRCRNGGEGSCGGVGADSALQPHSNGLGRHACRTKLPPKNFQIDTKKGLKNAKKDPKNDPKRDRNIFSPCQAA